MPGLCTTDTVEFFRIVRLVYVKPTKSPVSDVELPPSILYPVSYETFVPDLVQTQDSAASPLSSSASAAPLRVDAMRNTFAKVAAFLHHSGISITTIISITTTTTTTNNNNQISIAPYASYRGAVDGTVY